MKISTAAAVQNPTMAASNSTMASSSTSSMSSSLAMNLVNQLLLLLSNMSNMMTMKLDNTNYIVWKHQISMFLETYSLKVSFIISRKEVILWIPIY